MISVLCVDDETPLCELAKRILEETKEFSVDTAGSAEEALEKVHTMSYDAIVSGYQMSGMDGIELLKALRSSGITTPFIICIDNAQKDVIISAFENGADFYIGKDGDLTLHFAELAHKILAAVLRRKAEVALYQSEERFRFAMSQLPGTFWAVDRDLRYTFSQGAGLALLGLEPDQVLGMTLYEYFGTSDQSHPAISQHLLALAGETVTYDYTFRGATFHTTLTPLYDPEGKIKGVSGLAMDITDQRKMEDKVSVLHERLAASEQELRHQLETITKQDHLLQESNEKLQLKLDTILSPDYEIGELEFVNIIDSREIQSMMDDFYALTHIGVTIMDLKGNILVATGWQDICTKFHRVNTQSRMNCTESDLYLTQNVRPGEYLTYKCRNNMWDMVTPLFIGNKHMGNLFLGQFFFDDEIPDRALFAAQAEQFGFDREEYLAALDRVPRWSRETIETVMDFYTKFASMISRLIYGNVKLAKALLENQRSTAVLARSEEKYQAYTEHSPVGIFVVDRTGRYIDVNPAACRMLGYRRSDLLNMHITDITPADRVALELERFNGILVPAGKMSVESLLKKKDGTVITVILDATRLPDNTFMAFCSDITHRKAMENALVESELQYRLVVENAGEGIVVAQEGILKFVNPNVLKMTGLTYGQVINQPFESFIHPDDRALVTDCHQRRIRGENVPTFYDFRVLGEDGRITWVQISAVIILWKGRPATLNFLSDITKRKEVEIELHSAQERLIEVHRLAHIGTWDWVIDTDTVTWSEELYAITGRDTSLPAPSYAEHPQIYTPSSWERLSAAVTNAIETGEPYSLELEMVRPDGSIRWVSTFGRLQRDSSGKVTGLHGMVQDISERKVAEESLRESEIRFRDLFNNMSAGVAIYEPIDHATDFIFRDINHAVEQIEQVRKEEVIGKSVLNVFPGIKEFGLFEIFQRVARTGIAEKHPVSQYIDDRLTGWRENYIYKLNSGEIVAIYEDKTEKMQAEIALRESEERYREFFTTSRDSVFIISPEGRWIDFNETSLEMFNYESREELMAAPLQQLYDNPKDWDSMLACIVQKGYIRDYPVRLRRHDGPVIDTLVTAGAMRNHDGSVKAIIGSVRDITERKRAVEALRKSEQIYKKLVENISDVLFTVSPENIITYISPVVNRFGIRDKDVEGRPVVDFILPDSHAIVEKAVADVFSGRDVTVEIRVRNPPGDIFHVHISARPEWNDGTVTGIAGIMTDITSKKDLERLKVEALKKIDENLIEMAILNDQIRNPLAVIMAAADLAGGSTADDIIRQVQEIDAMINKIDRKWVESEKVREFLQKYYGVGVKG